MHVREAELALAQGEGLAPNFQRFAEFLGAFDGGWLEFQALDVPGPRGSHTRFAHGRTPAVWRSLLAEAETWNAVGVYLVANKINDAVATRAGPDRWHIAQRGQSTTDRDVVARRVVLFDVDRERPSGTSATDAEVAETVPIACALYDRLIDILGDADALGYGHSGNGRQVFLALDDLPETPDLAGLVKRLLEGVSAAFSDGAVKVDTSVVDAKRLMPAFGTTKRKGAGVMDRPHRPTAFVCDVLPRRLSREELDAVAEAFGQSPAGGASPPPATPKPRSHGLRKGFAKANGIPIADVVAWLGLEERDGVRCPGCGNTGGVKLVGNGLKCHHNSCSKKGVPNRPGFRTVVDLVAEAKTVSARDAGRQLEEHFLPPDPNEETHALLAQWDAAELLPLADTGNAERMLRMFGSDIRFCTRWDSWLLWDGNRWTEDDGGKGILGKTKAVVRAIPREGLGHPEQAKLTEFALESESASARSNIVRLTAGEPSVQVNYLELNSAKTLFSCGNGTLDLTTGSMSPARREDLFTMGSTVAYDPSAECPQWLVFLKRMFADDDELIGFMQRVAGYCMTGVVEEKGLFILHGDGANGKSTFTRTLQHVLGQYTVQMPRTLLLEKQHETHPTELTRLFRARLAVCQEIDAGKHIAEAQLKSLTGNDIITARRMHEDFWEFQPTHKFFLATNHRPVIRGVDEGIWRRICLVPFEVIIPEAERDAGLGERLLQEAPGILRWAVEGCLDWQRHGLRPPARVLVATHKYRGDEDLSEQFLVARCVRGLHYSVNAREVYQAFNAWCEESSLSTWSPKAFGDRLRLKGFDPVRGAQGARRWRGLRLMKPNERGIDGDRSAEEDDELEREAIRAEPRIVHESDRSLPF